jgi:integrase
MPPTAFCPVVDGGFSSSRSPGSLVKEKGGCSALGLPEMMRQRKPCNSYREQYLYLDIYTSFRYPFPMFKPIITNDADLRGAYATLRSLTDSYHNDRKNMFEYFDSIGISSPELKEFLDYAHRISETEIGDGKPYAPSSINAEIGMVLSTLEAARKLLRQYILSEDSSQVEYWLMIASQFDHARDALIKMRYKLNPKPTVVEEFTALSPDVIQDVISHLDIETALIVKIIFSSGMRLSEILALRWTDLDEVSNTQVRIKIDSGGFQRYVSLPSTIYQEIQFVFPRVPNFEIIFYDVRLVKPIEAPMIRERLLRAVKRMERPFPKVSTMTIRHSFAFYLLNTVGCEVNEVARYLGITSLDLLRPLQLEAGKKGRIEISDLPILT